MFQQQNVAASSTASGWMRVCACVRVVLLLCRPFVGRLSDLYGRLPFYYCGLTINICSALYVAWVGADMTSTAIVIFSVLRGFSQATVRRCIAFRYLFK
eukprot:COSAG06_NODE_886_length_11771_cov_13.431203_8_plen_99_part_00